MENTLLKGPIEQNAYGKGGYIFIYFTILIIIIFLKNIFELNNHNFDFVVNLTRKVLYQNRIYFIIFHFL